MATKPITLGIDGCKLGWLGVWHRSGGLLWRLEHSIETLLSHHHCDRAFIDIPIGLSPDERRECDTAARQLLGRGFSSSVFPTPVRSVLTATSYEDANIRHRKACGRGISKQSFFILPKIREVDTLLRNNKRWRGKLREAHPEVAFNGLNAGALSHKKKTPEGFEERLKLLSTQDSRVPTLVDKILRQTLRKHLLPDDILDAICLAVMPKGGHLRTLPQQPSKDAEGLPMEICYFAR